jgi:glycosyltransferase involved in cell wall biosynthesis
MNVGLSIVICSHNGKDRLELVLDSIERLHIPPKVSWEVMVVDNCSTDGTSDWLNDFNESRKWNFKVICIQENRPGLNFARLTGAKQAHHEWLLFCDDDNLLDADYVHYWYGSISSHPNLGAVGGKGVVLTEMKIPDWFKMYSHSYAVGAQLKSSGYVPTGSALYGAGLFVFKSPILEIVDKGFGMIMSDRKSGKLTSGGDLEWCYLLQLSGYALYYDDRMFFQHKIDSKRMQWSYYLKLKSGIASGAGLLEPYHFIFKNGFKSIFSFLISYIFRSSKATLVFLAVFIKSSFYNLPKKSETNELAMTVLKAKAWSFWFNMWKAHVQFIQLKKTFHASV